MESIGYSSAIALPIVLSSVVCGKLWIFSRVSNDVEATFAFHSDVRRSRWKMVLPWNTFSSIRDGPGSMTTWPKEMRRNGGPPGGFHQQHLPESKLP